jgi:hypothetical protein
MENKTQLTTTGTNTPAALILQAVQSNTDLDKLKGLLELQERWEANEARKAYHQAMSDFKAEHIEHKGAEQIRPFRFMGDGTAGRQDNRHLQDHPRSRALRENTSDG